MLAAPTCSKKIEAIFEYSAINGLATLVPSFALLLTPSLFNELQKKSNGYSLVDKEVCSSSEDEI